MLHSGEMSFCHTSSRLMLQDCFSAQAEQLLSNSNLLLNTTVMKNNYEAENEFSHEIVSVVEHNRTWQMAMRVCFNTAKIVNHVAGAFGNL